MDEAYKFEDETQASLVVGGEGCEREEREGGEAKGGMEERREVKECEQGEKIESESEAVFVRVVSGFECK